VAGAIRTSLGALVSVIELPEPQTLAVGLLEQELRTRLGIFTWEGGQELYRQALLDDTELQEVPVVFVLTSTGGAGIPAAVAERLLRTIADDAADLAPLATKLRFATVALCPTGLEAADDHAKEIAQFWDERHRQGGGLVEHCNPLLLVCREFRGAPVGEDTLVPILSRLACLLLGFDYHLGSGSFSDCWNTLHATGGRFFTGLRIYRVQNVAGAAAQLLCGAAKDRIRAAWERAPRQQMSFTGGTLWERAGHALAPGSQAWQDQVAAARDKALSFVAERLPLSGGFGELDAELSGILDCHCPVRGTAPEPETSVMLGALPIGAAALPWAGAGLAAALLAVASVYFLQGHARGPAPPEAFSESVADTPEPNQASEFFCEALSEIRDALRRGFLHDPEASDVRLTAEAGAPASGVPFQMARQGDLIGEVLFKPQCSVRGREVAKDQVSRLGYDLLLLIAGIFVNTGWSTGRRAADLASATQAALQAVGQAIREDFLRFTRQYEDASEVRSALFAPESRVDEVQSFCFIDPALAHGGPGGDRFSMPDTVHYLHLVP
jgi:hypothetical protein